MGNPPEQAPSSRPTPPAPSQIPDDLGGVAKVLRVIIPVLLLAAGWIAFNHWMKPEEREKKPPGMGQPPKTKVVELTMVNFEPQIETDGLVRAHNEITLTSQVAGRIVRLHPQFDDGAFFEEGTVLVELEEADFKTAVATANSQLAQATAAHTQEEARSKQARLNWEDLGYEDEPNDLVLRLPQLHEAEARVTAAEAQLEQAKRDLERSKIRAPFDGRVRERLVGVSQTIGSGSALGTIFTVDYAEVRLPIGGDQMRFIDLPEEPGDPPVDLLLRDALDETNETEWKASIVRTEGALNEESLELFAIARIDDPFGRDSGTPPLRIGQPVTAKVPGRPLEKVVAIPREAVRQLSLITVVDPESHTISKHTVIPLWSNDTHLIVRDETVPSGTLLATANLTYTPDGTKVEILPDSPEAGGEEDEPPAAAAGADGKKDG